MMADKYDRYTISQRSTIPSQELKFHENVTGFICFECHTSETWDNPDRSRTVAERDNPYQLPDREVIKRVAQVNNHVQACVKGRNRINTYGLVVVYEDGNVRALEAHVTKYADGSFRSQYEKMLGMWRA
jgi:hypothetical protein